MRNSKEYLKRLTNKIILETLEDKAYDVMEKIKSSEFDYVAEGDVCEQCGGTELLEGECVECGAIKGGAEMLEKLYGRQSKLDKNKNGRLDKQDFKMLRGDMQEKDCMECGKSSMYEGDICECGGDIKEGMCMECGKMEDSEILEFGSNQAFTGGMELEEKWKGDVKVKKTGEHAGKSISEINSRIKALKDLSQSYQEKGESVPKKLKEKISELYFAKRSKKGWPGKGKVDVDEEMEEGNAFTGKLAHTEKGGKFKLGNKEYTDNSSLEETLYRIVDGTESALFTENEVIDIIENIVKEEKKKEKSNIKKGVTPKGLGKYEKIHKESGKENNDYIQSVVKKFKDYLSPGSKGKFEMSPKHFPKGNGQLAKMDKKAYELPEEGFDHNYQIAGPNIPDYDDIGPDKEKIKKQIKGSAENGNSQDWANAEKTEVNDKFSKFFDEDLVSDLKDKSYKRYEQPVILTGKKGKKSNSTKKINEEFERISELITYSRKTQ